MGKRPTKVKKFDKQGYLIEKAANEAAEKAALKEWRIITALFLIVLSDHYNMTSEQLNDIHHRVCDYAEKIYKKEIKTSDIFDVLKKEYNIIIAKEI